MACTCQPGKPLCRECLRPLEERNAVSTGPLVNGRGEYTLNQINVFEQSFRNTIVSDVQNNPLSESVKKYGNSIYDTTNTLNNDFFKRPYIQDIISDYPLLDARLKKGAITPLEMSDFIKGALYTPGTVIESWNANGSRFCNELENYYNNGFANSILGGFCSLFGSVFGAIDAFFDMIGQLDALIQDALSFISKIKNIKDEVLAIFEAIKVKALIEAIKEKIASMIEKTIEQICQTIANFNVEAITGPLPTPTTVQTQIVQQVEERKSSIAGFCGEENIAMIKAKLKALIDYAVGLFENPSVEEIMFLIARICGFATGLEGLINKLKDPLADFANRYDEVLNTISNASNRVTGEAIRAGAIRLAPEQRERLINNAREAWVAAGNIEPPGVEEFRDVNINWDDLRNGRVNWLRIQGGWVTRMVPPEEGWTRLDGTVKVLIRRFYDAARAEGIISGPIFLNSGYRNPVYNEEVDGARASQHLQGTACDLTWSGFDPNRSQTYANLARRIGFRGVGYYNTFIHFDIGPERFWDRRG